MFVRRVPPLGCRAYSSFFSSKAGGQFFTSAKPPKSVAATTAGRNVLDQYRTVLNHPSIDSTDFKLHQFFSLHRPLLLLSQPTSAIFDSPPANLPSHPFNASSSSSIDSSTSGLPSPPPAHLGALDDPPESLEAYTDTARLLSRAHLVVRVGGLMAWQKTLERLGIELGEGEARLKDMLEKGWADAMMDSTKRKRKSKMKRHKLKKRRKATRAQRLRMGK